MIAWAAEAMAASTLLMAAIMMIRLPAARYLGAQAAYLLWLLPALRMVLPALPTQVAPVHAMRFHLHLASTGSKPVSSAVSAASAVISSTTATDWTLPILTGWLRSSPIC